MLEQKRLSVLRREPREGAIYRVVPPQPVYQIGIGRRVRSALCVANEESAPSRCSSAHRPTAVYEDAVQPRPEPAGVVAPRERSVCPYECVLQCFFRVLPVANHVHGVAAEAVAIARDQSTVRSDVAAANPAHQLCVAHLHLANTHPRIRHVTFLLGGRCDAAYE